MTLLDKLWDDTVAGPLPDSGLGILRKHYTFSSRFNSGSSGGGGNRSQRPPPPLVPTPRDDDDVKTTRRSIGGDDVQLQGEARRTIIGNTACAPGEEGGPFRLRKQMGLDPIALLLLTCDL